MRQNQSGASAGFTLIELMVTLAVAAVLLGLAVPAFNELVRQRAMIARINDMVLAISYARSEAVRLGGQVSLQALSPEAGNQWGAAIASWWATPAIAIHRSCEPSRASRT
jgi:type IV fimbrial biogenesis protein FimT